MKRFFILFSLLLTLAGLPRAVFAINEATYGDDNDQCRAGTYGCTCLGDNGSTSTGAAAETASASTCDTWCGKMHASSYTYTCTLGNGTANTPVAQGNVGSTATTTPLEESVPEEEPDFIVPNLIVKIPGFDGFSDPTKDATGTVEVNFIAEYINAFYGWILAAGALVAVVMMMVGGLQYVMSRGKEKYITKAKERITNAITGLVLLFAAYNIAFLIDPELVNLQPLDVQFVEGIESFPPEGEDIDIVPNTALTGDSVPIQGTHIRASSGATIDSGVLAALQSAANTFYNATGKNVVVSSGARDLKKQAQMFYDNCLRTGTCSPITCNPASSSVVAKSGSRYVLTGELSGVTSSSAIISAMVNNASPGNCPHTSAVALDAWCDDGGSNYRHDPVCQTQLIQSMIGAGFCRLSAEAWHFELNSKKVSSACSTSNNTAAYTIRGKLYTPPSNCQKWDFRLHTCRVEKN
jgi:hypothetical protein